MPTYYTFDVKNAEILRTVPAVKASGVTITPKTLVTLSSGLVVEADSASTALGYAPNGADSGTTSVDVTVGNNFTLVGTADTGFAVTDKGGEVDLTDSQKIDLGTSTTDVLKVAIGESAGTAGAATSVEVKINKPLF